MERFPKERLTVILVLFFFTLGVFFIIFEELRKRKKARGEKWLFEGISGYVKAVVNIIIGMLCLAFLYIMDVSTAGSLAFLLGRNSAYFYQT